MRVFGALFLLFTICVCHAFAQQTQPGATCAQHKINTFREAAKATVASPEEELYDVKSVNIDLIVDNDPVFVSGQTTTAAVTLEDNFGLYVFELVNELEIELININGQPVEFIREGDIVKAILPNVLQSGTLFRAEVFYKGTPKTGTVFFFQNGLNRAPDEEWNSPVTYTLSEPYASKDWWPCKQSLQDKIDSATIAITVDDSLMAGSNGILAEVQRSAGKARYIWKTKYPVAYYLLSIAVADYRDYSFTTTLNDGKEVLVQNYIYDRPGYLQQNKAGIDATGDMLINFSELFGTYPFHEEKYGHCVAPVFGGLEHQTMTTLSNFNTKLVSHELAHQWWGDHVTCATWRDIWLNEGFATYSEYLHQEKYRTPTVAYKYMLNIHEQILTDTNKGGSIYLPAGDTVNPYRIFDTRLSYLKPGAVLHTLRYVIDNDEVFFNALRQFQRQYAFGNATTEEFKNVVENISGLELDYFFDQWFYKEGYPIYKARWNQLGNKVMIEITQETTVPSSIAAFDVPLELKLEMSGSDTTIKLDNATTTTSLSFSIDGVISNLVIDPRNMILNEAEIYRDYSMGVAQQQVADDAYIYPNPTHTAWYVTYIKAGTELSVVDMHGRVVWQGATTNDYGIAIPAERMARGTYILKMQYGDKQLTSKKLIKL